MIYDFFVHAQAPYDRDYQMSMQRATYFSSIIHAVTSSQNPIGISEIDSDPYLRILIPPKRFLITLGKWDPLSANGGSGFVRPEDAVRFMEIVRPIRPTDRVRIHGAFYGQCPTDFAVQLYYALQTNKFLEPASGEIGFVVGEIIEKGDLTRSNLEWGIIFGNPNLESEERLEATRQLHRSTSQFFR